jgi:hypothetical protein
MIQPDTIKLLNDSTHALPHHYVAKVDSAAILDSIARADSLHVADSIKAIVRVVIPTGHAGIPHPSLPGTEYWVFPVLVCLFFLLVFSIARSGSLIPETIKNFFQVKERSSIFSKATVNDFQIRIFLIIFSVGVMSLYAYLQIHKPGSDFSLLIYAYTLVITAIFVVLKSLIFDVIGYVFMDQATAKMAKESYFNVFSLLGLLLFPLLIIQVYIPYNFNDLIELISLITCIIAYLLIIFKLFQIFFHKIIASFYILLYLCTLEFLPLFALYQVYKFIM